MIWYLATADVVMETDACSLHFWLCISVILWLCQLNWVVEFFPYLLMIVRFTEALEECWGITWNLVYIKAKGGLFVMYHTAYTKIQHFIHVCSGTDKTATDPMTFGGAATHTKYWALLYIYFFLDWILISLQKQYAERSGSNFTNYYSGSPS